MLKPAAAVLKKVEQQSQAKQEHGARKCQLDEASTKTKAKKRSEEECKNDKRQNRSAGCHPSDVWCQFGGILYPFQTDIWAGSMKTR